MYRLFDLRVALRGRIAEFERMGFMTPEAAQALRNAFRILRYVTDMLGEISIGHARLAPGEATYRAFTGGDRNTLVNYAYQRGMELPLQSGDIVLVRGHAHNSAAIARIGDVDSQFSHIGIVYVDADNKGWMVEALIEDGAVITPLGAAFDHGLVRAVLYRHRNAKLAAKAAEAIHALVAQSLAADGKQILYDFTMRLDDRRELFCSKLVRLAYATASNGEIKLPAYPTRVFMKNRDFLNRIGVKCEHTFAPHDIDLEVLLRSCRRVAGLSRDVEHPAARLHHGQALPVDGRARSAVPRNVFDPLHLAAWPIFSDILETRQGNPVGALSARAAQYAAADDCNHCNAA